MKSPWTKALKARLNSVRDFQSTTHFVVEVNRAFSAVLRDFYPCILGRSPGLGVDRCAFGADHRLKAWLPAQVVSAPSVGYCSKLKLKNFCA